MSTDTQQVVSKAWNFAHVLRDDGLSYMGYVEQITFLLFLKMADERHRLRPHERPIVEEGLGWQSLLSKDGEAVILQYRKILQDLSGKPGMLGEVFRQARPEIQKAVTLRRLIVEFIDKTNWSSLKSDVKGDIYEGLLDRSAIESPKGAGQYFTPRELIRAIVDCVQPTATDTVSDPACGTGGFLVSAYNYVVQRQASELDPDDKRHLKRGFVRGTELVPNTARLCIMNLMLHGIDADPCPIASGKDSLAIPPGEKDRVSLVLTNPPFGKKSTFASNNEKGETQRDDETYERPDFWTSTKNKQLNFLQHVKNLLKINGRCAIVVPDNVLFEGGAGEVVRRKLLEQCDVHTLLRLPTGIFYAQGVKANVLFFDAKPAREKAWTDTLWVYDYRTNIHHTLKTRPLKRPDLDEFVACYAADDRRKRNATWGEANPDGRWRPFSFDEIARRDKLNLDIFWIKDQSLEDAENLPEPDVIAQEIADDLQAALEQFAAIAAELKGE